MRSMAPDESHVAHLDVEGVLDLQDLAAIQVLALGLPPRVEHGVVVPPALLDLRPVAGDVVGPVVDGDSDQRVPAVGALAIGPEELGQHLVHEGAEHHGRAGVVLDPQAVLVGVAQRAVDVGGELAGGEAQVAVGEDVDRVDGGGTGGRRRPPERRRLLVLARPSPPRSGSAAPRARGRRWRRGGRWPVSRRFGSAGAPRPATPGGPRPAWPATGRTAGPGPGAGGARPRRSRPGPPCATPGRRRRRSR